MGKSSKGSEFEREVCTTLSLWWTGGERDDIFWRSSGSGARANTRAKAGKRTGGQYCDIAAIDPSGHPLTGLLVFELKRGYATTTPYDCLDRIATAAEQRWEEFIRQAARSVRQANAFGWAVVSRRDRRTAWIWFPKTVCTALRAAGAWPNGPPATRASIVTEIRKVGVVHAVGMPLTSFLEGVTRGHIEELYAEWH